ncbi:hypothetical protein [Mesorhizobium sp. WSM2561]|uniref:hypothetical protein n=1 Tax=Mesorhizobium sp. WSM2561 TaxID=1040985 RepID=UPI000485EE3D|nr:hypothetical protein [Mesorhizobium sp. WSM2561]
MISVGRYTFSSWLRRGIGTRITQPDSLGAGTSGVPERATVPIDVSLNGTGISKNFALIGPGDIIGINPHMVVRTEPRNWISNFEPNYLAFIEFYDEDFLWRYTPARPSGEKLSPWLSLLVLEAPDNGQPGEYEVVNRRDPLPALRITAPGALPPLTQNWAFSHVSVNEGHANPTEFEEFLLSLREPGTINADKIISRLFSPRKLQVDTAYRAFLVPAFETGRLAGLGQDPSGADAQAPAWAGSSPVELPYYYEWYFRTGENEDFESLVKRLEPRPVDTRVGIRDMDASHPGFGLATGADIGTIPPPVPTHPPPPQTVVGLEGALRAPDTVSRPANIDTTKPFFDDLADMLNMADDRVVSSPGPVDPLVTPPIYGSKHAMKPRVNFATPGWMTSLNRDPRLRVPAGFGTRVVQRHQEDYVARAWAQVRQILAMNRRMKLGRFAMETAKTMHATFFANVSAVTLLTVAKQVTKKVMGSPTTIHYLVGASLVTSAPLDSAMRRLLRGRGVVARRLTAADPGFTQDRLVEDINEGKVTAAPPKDIPQGLPSDEDVANGAGRPTPGWIDFIRRHFWWLLILLLLLAGFLFLIGLWIAALACLVVSISLVIIALRRPGRGDVAPGISDPSTLPGMLAEVPPQPGFSLVETDPPPRPGASGITLGSGHVGITPGGYISVIGTSSHSGGAGADSIEGRNFRRAASSIAGRLGIKLKQPARPKLDLGGTAGKLAAALDPERAWPILIAREVILTFSPGWLQQPEHLVPALAYPDFDDPMYEKLRDLSAELFLPNLKLIPPDTITLLKTNPPFIESYMVGLNHEFGRELLWREYPTDERGSYFRQFWSVRGLVVPPPDPAVTTEQLKAMYRDIAPLDTWTTLSALGTHKPPERPKTGDLVLTIRGELLKKYPNTLVYAQKAHMARNASGALDPSMKPVILPVTTEAEMNVEIRFPLFTAEIEPDIRFFGFDLTIEQAEGDDDPDTESDDWGWYFVIQELPGEPRFGLDIEFGPDDDNTTPITWNDLSWDRVSAVTFLSPATPPVPAFFNLLAADLKAQWGRHAADMAAILFQRPVMIAVHAREMLEKLNA